MVFPDKQSVCDSHLSSMRSTVPAHPICVDQVALTVYEEECRSGTPLEREIFYLLSDSKVQIRLSSSCFQTSSVYGLFYPQRRPYFTPIQNNRYHIVNICVYCNLYVLGMRREDNRFSTEWQQALPELNLLLIYSE